MKIPSDDAKRLQLYEECVAACLASRQRRLAVYVQNRNWYLYGTAGGEISPWNKVYSHLDTVTSFLYAADSTRFSTRLTSLAPPDDYKKLGSFSKRVNEEWKASNADIIFQNAILWSLIYDTMLVKLIRRGSQVIPFAVDPGSFGVYREDIPMLDRQEAFCHVFYMTRTDLERRLKFHPKAGEIIKNITATAQKTDTISQTPPLIQRVITTATEPDLTGNVNLGLDVVPEYEPKIEVPLIEMQELWVWDDANDDYQCVTMASGNVCVFDRKNLFLPRSREWDAEQPFIQVCPNPMYDYFWGAAEVARLAPLQDKRNVRMDDIQRLLAKQVDPPNAWGGMGLVEDKLDAFNSPGAKLAISDPNFKRESFAPTIPQDVYADVRQLDAEFDDVSGLTNVLAGRGEAGVRSSGHASKLASLGSSRPKKRALIIEDALEQAATLYGKCIYADDTSELFDDTGVKFVPAQMTPHFLVEVDAHSNSPVFMENQRENAVLLLKSKAITRKRFIQMLAPPMQEELIRDLETEILPQEKAAAEARMKALAEGQAGKGGKGGLKSVA